MTQSDDVDQPLGRDGTGFPWWLLGLFVAVFSFFTDDYIIVGILPEVAVGLDVSEAAAGQLVTVFAMTMALATPIAGFAFSRVPRRLLVCAALGGFVLANGAATLVSDFWILVALRVAAALAAASAVPAIFAAAAELSPDSLRGRYLGIISVAVTGSFALGVAVGVWIAEQWSWHHTFGFMAACGLLALLLVLRTFPETAIHPPIPLREQFATLRSRPISFALAGGAVAIFGSMMLLTYLAPFLRELVGESADRGLVLTVFGVMATVGVFAGGWLVDKVGANKTLLISMISFIALMIVLALVATGRPISQAVLMPIVVAWGFLAYSSATPVQVRLHALAGPLTAKVLAINSSVGTLAVAASAAVGGFVVNAGGVLAFPIIAAVCTVIGMALLMIAFGTGRSPELNDAGPGTVTE